MYGGSSDYNDRGGRHDRYERGGGNDRYDRDGGYSSHHTGSDRDVSNSLLSRKRLERFEFAVPLPFSLLFC